MSQSILPELAHDASDASWRLAARQLSKLATEPIAAALGRNLAPDDDALRGRISRFLETDLGRAMVESLLAMGLAGASGLLPGVSPAVLRRLTSELRVGAMVDAGDVAADVIMAPLREVIGRYLQGVTLPAEPQTLPSGPQMPAEAPLGNLFDPEPATVPGAVG